MKRKIAIAVIAFAVVVSSVFPAAQAGAVTIERDSYAYLSEDDEDYDDDEQVDGYMEDEDDTINAGEFTKYDIRTSPARKTIRIGKSFYITVKPERNTEWEDYTDEEWDEICEENIDEIYYRSTKSSVASVNKETGKVTARKKGVATIKASVSLANGETAVYKTKVYVTR